MIIQTGTFIDNAAQIIAEYFNPLIDEDPHMTFHLYRTTNKN